MALRPQSPRSRPALAVRPAAGVGGGGGLAQSFMRNNKHARSRIIRYLCTISNSGCPNSKSRRTASPNIKVTAFRGYAPRLTVESSTKKREHNDSDEEPVDKYNKLLTTDVPEWTGGREVESHESGLPQNASSSSTLGEVDAVEEAGMDIFEDDFPENSLNDISRGQADAVNKAESEEDYFEVDLSRISLELDAVNEAEGKKDVFAVAGHALSNGTMGEIDVVGEAKAEEEKSEVDLQEIALNSAEAGKVDATDEAETKEDLSVEDSPENALSNVTMGEMDAVVEAKSKEDIYVVDSSRNPWSNVIGGEVDAMDQAKAKQDKFESALSRTALGSAALDEVAAVDKAKAKEDVFVVGLSGIAPNSNVVEEVEAFDEVEAEEDIVEVDLLGFPSINTTTEEEDLMDEDLPIQEAFGVDLSDNTSRYEAVDSADETVAEEDNYQHKYTLLSETSMETKAIDKTSEILKPGLMSLVRVQGPDRLFFSEKGSAADFHQPVVDIQNQVQKVTAFDEQNQSIVGFPKQDLSIAHLREKSHYIIGSPKQEQSIVGFHKQDQSIVGYYRQDTSIVGIPNQTKSIVGSSKLDQSIVGYGKHHQSIVRFAEQKKAIVSFHKQDLSVVGTSRDVHTKQVAIVGSDDARHVRGVEANIGDYTSQKSDAGKLNVMFDVVNLLQKNKENIIEEAEMTTSKKTDEEHLLMVEEQRNVTKEGIEVQMRIDEDKLLHFLPKEEMSWAEFEAGIINEREHYDVDETSMPVEPDIEDSEADVVKADSTINLFLNRDLTALANEPDVLVKGAFNGWRWRLFTERLHKSELGGSWWSCKLYIPKEAYKLDFVFFNGRTVYENNGNNDFVMQIESSMDEHLFEDFLLEEKRRQQTDEAERRRQTDDQRRMEEERVANEAVRAQAKAEVGMKKKKIQDLLKSARTSVEDLWYIEPIMTRQGSAVRLYYNKKLRSLAHSTEIWIHGGYNNWIDGLSFAEQLVQHNDKDSEWWYVEVVVPERAYVLDWVFADGPPGNARNFDNNGRQDFHAILPNIKTDEGYWMDEEQRIYTRLLQERIEREEAIKRKAERSAKMKAEMKEKTMRMFLVSQKHIVYTEPLEIRAGTTVDVLYNPSNTVLNGKPEIWFRCSFNRWMHTDGVLQPQKMVKAENGSHLKATVNVPADAYVMDFVFSEWEEGGIFDNRNGLDYHVPVFGSTAKEPSRHIVHIAVEMAPIAKVGGLGDVVTSLSRAVQDLGHNVEVILPKHDCLNLSCVKNLHVRQSFSWGGTEIRVWSGLVEEVSVYFLEPQNGMFGVGCVYGRNDDRRFGFFCHSALEFLLQSGSSPHIIHCHDWSSAPVAWLYKEHYAQSSLANARVVFTIHNLEFGAHYIGKAMKYCDKATTVSNTYSREVSAHGAIAPHLGKFYGILNGIDPDIWDPYNDNFIPVHYTSENVVEGKRAAKKALQQKLGLQQNDVPIVGIITRLTAQKGIHLIKHAIHRILEQNGQVVLLGSAPDHRIQNDFCNLANTLHGVNYGRVRMCLTYDEPLSHLIYAGSDFIFVPSIFEPCGLTQLVAMRYGSIPIVRKTGGLYDTVFDVEHDKDRARGRGLEPNGFSFEGADTNGVDYVLNRQAQCHPTQCTEFSNVTHHTSAWYSNFRAITAWFDAREWFQSLCKRVMEQDWSWNRPALDYIELYRSAGKF
ncbi:hypothetical protein EJB05_09583, partial [Eragrostis curvula]